MKRKVNLVGQNTLTVSLPTKWARKNNVKKGDELDIGYDKNSVIFSVKPTAKATKEASLNIDNYSLMELTRKLSVLYKTGFNKITLTYSKHEIYNHKERKWLNIKTEIKRLAGRFIGAEIISQSSTKTEIKCFVTEENPDLGQIEKRIYFLLKETTDELLNAIDNTYEEFHGTIYNHHDNIIKFIHYFLRELHASDKSEELKNEAYSFYILLDTLVDKLRHLSEKIDAYGCTAKVKKYLEEIFIFFYEQFQLLDGKIKYGELIEKRYALKKKIDDENFTVKELQVLPETNLFLEVINNFIEYSVIKNIDNKQSDISLM